MPEIRREKLSSIPMVNPAWIAYVEMLFPGAGILHYHFSQKSLEEMVKIAGFDVVAARTSYDDVLIKIIAKKR